MVVTLSIPDEVYEKYVAFQPQNPRAALVKQLSRFQDLKPEERGLVLSQEERVALEKASGAKFETGRDVISWAQRAASLKVGEVEVALSPGQLKRVEGEARFYKRDFKQVLEKKVKDGLQFSTGGL